ncbi:MAG: DUF4349 domain-containing protein [Candidatus Methanomethylicia archaeon]
MNKILIIILILVSSLIVGIGVNWPSVTGALGRSIYSGGLQEVLAPSPEAVRYPAPTIPALPTATLTIDKSVVSISPVVEDKMIVKTGYVKLTVSNITLAYQQLINLALGFDGYVHNSKGYEGGATVELRIPSSRFEEAMLAVQQIGKVESVSISTQDVTEQVIDLRSRLNASRALESRLLQLLNRAVTVDDVLKIEDQLTRVRADIERMDAQLKGLIGRVEYAAITIELTVRYRVYRVDLSCETSNVQEEFNNLIIKIGVIGRIMESWSGGSSAYLVVEVKTEDVQKIEEMIEAKITDRKLGVVESSIDKSTITIRIVKPKTVEMGIDFISTIQSGINAMIIVISLIVSGALAIIPIALVGGVGYLGYKTLKTKVRKHKTVK